MARAQSFLAGARRVESPNFDERPAGTAVTLLVVHAISLPPGTFGGDAIERLFTNRLDRGAHPAFAEIAGLRVSAHFLLRRNGELLQFVPADKRAWHAGASCWRGRERCNDFSIGIEMEGSDDQPFTHEQYQTLIHTTQTIRKHYPAITPKRITSHAAIAPQRKTDPGPLFDWTKYLASLDANSTSPVG